MAHIITNYAKAVMTGDVELFLKTTSSLKIGTFSTGLDAAFFIIQQNQQDKLLHLVEDAVGKIRSSDLSFYSETLLQDFVRDDKCGEVLALSNLEINFEHAAKKKAIMNNLLFSISSMRMFRLLRKIGFDLIEHVKSADVNFFAVFVINYASRFRFESLFYFESNGLDLTKYYSVLGKYSVWKKIYLRSLARAANKIRFAWLPLCYDMKRESGKRMAERNFEKLQELYQKEK